jgi:hypothetical protein
MSRHNNEPLEHIKGCFSESPIDECFQFEQEGYGHEGLKCEFVHYAVAIHHEATLLYLGHTFPDLHCTNPEVSAIQNVEKN